MRILLVEDDEAKRDQVVSHLRTVYKDPTICQAASFRTALTAIMDSSPQVVLLDMTMPAFEDTGRTPVRPLVYGGRDVIRQMERLELIVPVIVLTQYDQFGEGANIVTLEQLDFELRSLHPRSYAGYVSFSFVYDSWRNQLDRLLGAAGYPPERSWQSTQRGVAE